MEPRNEAIDDEGIFWTDMEQATERLVGTWITYDGKPFYVQSIHRDERDNKLRITLQGKEYRETGVLTKKFLNAAKFNKFRILPKTGWINDEERGRAKFLERLPRRNRQHGLTETNTRLYTLLEGALVSDGSINSIGFSKGYDRANAGEFPSFANTLPALGNGVGIAISSKYCLYKTDTGAVVLYREKETIGIFTSKASLLLFAEKAYYKEEILASPELRGIQVGTLSYA